MTLEALRLLVAIAVPLMADGRTPIVPRETVIAFALYENPRLDPNARNENRNGTYDEGLMQVNSANFAALGLRDPRDPAQSIRAASILLARDYATCLAQGTVETVQCLASYYNTGTRDRGLTNGYVAGWQATAKRLADGSLTSNSGTSTDEVSEGPVVDAVALHRLPSEYPYR